MTDSLFHYTTAEAICSIVANGSIRATRADLLNDPREVYYLFELTREVVRRSRLMKGVLGREVTPLLDEPQVAMPFIASFSAAPDLLSQWRAYSGSDGYGLEYSRTNLQAVASRCHGRLHECGYAPSGHERQVRRIISHAHDAHERWRPLGKDHAAWTQSVARQLLTDILLLAPQMKRSGFREEREWRIVIPPRAEAAVQFRTDRTCIKPFLELRVGRPSAVMCGPGSDVLAEAGVRALLDAHAPAVPVRQSSLTYRR